MATVECKEQVAMTPDLFGRRAATDARTPPLRGWGNGTPLLRDLVRGFAGVAGEGKDRDGGLMMQLMEEHESRFRAEADGGGFGAMEGVGGMAVEQSWHGAGEGVDMSLGVGGGIDVFGNGIVGGGMVDVDMSLGGMGQGEAEGEAVQDGPEEAGGELKTIKGEMVVVEDGEVIKKEDGRLVEQVRRGTDEKKESGSPISKKRKKVIATIECPAHEAKKNRAAAIKRLKEKKLLRKFEKKVRYQCRKRIALHRPRIHGRFATKEEVELYKNKLN